MRKLFTTKKRILIATGAGVLVLATGGTAFAYFTASGSGTGSASVGSTGTWAVSQSTTTLPTGTIYPGSGSTVITFDVKNTGTGDQQITNPSVVMAQNATTKDAETGAGNTDITGCLAAWFSPSVTSQPAAGTNVAGGQTVQIQVTVTMPADSTDDQDKCQGVTPNVVLSVA